MRCGVFFHWLAGVESTEASTSRWEGIVAGASFALLQFLQRMGAQQLCVRVVAGMAMAPPAAVDVLDASFSGLANKVFVHLQSTAVGSFHVVTLVHVLLKHACSWRICLRDKAFCRGVCTRE